MDNIELNTDMIVDIGGSNESFSVDSEPDEIIIEINGLVSVNKFIGLADTPLIYEDGKFFKVDGQKLVYTDVDWSDIHGEISSVPELYEQFKEIAEQYSEEFIVASIMEAIQNHNQSTTAHQSILDKIQELYNGLEATDEDVEFLKEKVGLITGIRNDIVLINSQISTIVGNVSTNTNEISNVKNTINSQQTLIESNRTLINQTISNLQNYAKKSTLSDVAFSGLYEDLVGKPYIPDVSNLTTKSYVDNKINQAIGSITGLRFEIVASLPQEGEAGVIYLVPHIHSQRDIYDEYVWVELSWEKIGSTDIDLSRYTTKQELNSSLSTKVDKVQGSRLFLEVEAEKLASLYNYNDTELRNKIDTKQNILTAGENITISNNTISATNTTYSAGEGIEIANGTIANTEVGKNAWGKIVGNISNQTDLQNQLSTKANIDDIYTKQEIDAKVSSIYRVKGSVATYENLPTIGNEVGDVYNVLDSGANYVWTSTGWDKLSETVDLSPYATKQELTSTYETKSNVQTIQQQLQSNIDTKQPIGNYLTESYREEVEQSIEEVEQQIPTKLSQLTDDLGSSPIHTHSQYLTEHQDISNKVDKQAGYRLVSEQEISKLESLENYDDTELQTKTSSLQTQLYGKQSKLTAGVGIEITSDNTINATSETVVNWGDIEGEIREQEDLQQLLLYKQDRLTAGTGIEITDNNVINNTQTSAEWGNIQGDITDQEDLQEALLQAGTPDNITVTKTEDNKLQTIGSIDSNENRTYIKTWTGTEEQYNSIVTKDEHTIYNVEDDLDGLVLYSQPLLSTMWSDHILNDMCWLRADTFSWHSGNLYTSVYNKLVEEWNSTTEADAKQVDGIWCRVTKNGYKITYSAGQPNIETELLNKYNTDGIAWYYILDTTNKRFKLPRTKFGFEGLRTNVGDDISESLPNIKGNTGNAIGDQNPSGAIYTTVVGNYPIVSSGYTWERFGTEFNASRSSSTYQDNAPVQERATQMYLYFYVGEYAQSAIEQTAGITSEQLNNRLDISLTNATSQTKSSIVNYCMPDYSQQIYPDTTMVAGTLIYVSKDSYVIVWSANSYIEDYYTYVTDDTTSPMKYVVGHRYDDTNGNTEAVSFSFPVPKGWYFTCYAENGFNYRILPYKGAE